MRPDQAQEDETRSAEVRVSTIELFVDRRLGRDGGRRVPGAGRRLPQTVGGTSTVLHLYTEDVDALGM